MDGLTLYLSRTCDNLCSRTIVLLSYNISPLCDVAQTSDCGVFLFLTLNISPLCDVAQTSDCGTHCHLYTIISPLCGVALTPDCGIVIFIYPFEESFRHSIGLQYYFGISGGLPPDFPFISHALPSRCLSALC